jgi:hypothetical protein
MMALALLTELHRQGVRFIANGGKLQVISPKGVALSDTMKAEIRRHKEEILSRLRVGRIITQDVGSLFPGAAVVEADGDLGTCARCAGRRWWVSRFGVRSCASCFPPSQPGVVVAWISPRAAKRGTA